MAFSERLALIITANADQALREIGKVGKAAEKDLGSAENRVDHFASSSLKIGAGLVAAGGVALPVLARLGQGASNLNEQISGSNVVFRENAREVQAWSRDLDSSFGISQRAALTAANNFGALFTGVGLARDEATDMSRRLVELAADLASLKDLSGGAEEALERLRSGLVGEAEPLRRMDIFLNEAAVSAKAAELGIANLGDKLTDGQKIQARYALILEQTALAQGDFARTSDSLANSQRIAAAEAENASNAFGQGVVGPMTAATQAATGLVRGLGDLSPELASTAGTIATLGAATAIGVGGLALLSGGVLKARAAFQGADNDLNNFGKAAKGLGVVAGVAGTLLTVKAGLDALGLSARGLELDLAQLAKTADRELVSAFDKVSRLEGEASRFFDALPLDQQQRLVSALREMGRETGDLEAKIRNRAKAEAEGAASTEAAQAALKGLAGATEDSTSATEENTTATLDAVKAAEALADQRERILDATIAAVDSERGYARALDSLDEAQVKVNEKGRAYEDIVKAHGRGSIEAARAAEELSDAQRDLVDEYLAVAEAAQRQAQDQATAEGRTLTAADSYRVYRDELIRLKDTIAPGSPLRVALEEVINKLPPPEVKFAVVADTAQADAALEKLRQQWLRFNQQNPGAVGPSLFGPVGSATVPPPRVRLSAGSYHGGGLVGDGGLVVGSQDEVPALVRRGEFILREESVRKIGLPTLERLNRYHSGGLVGTPSAPSPVASAPNITINQTVHAGDLPGEAAMQVALRELAWQIALVSR